MIDVKDLPSMAAFYSAVLGLKTVTRTETWLAFKEGVALHAIPPQIAAEIEILSPLVAREESPVKLVLL